MFMFQSTLSGPFLVAFIVILELSSSNSKGLNLQHDQRDDDQKRAFLEAFANVVKQPLYGKLLCSLLTNAVFKRKACFPFVKEIWMKLAAIWNIM